RPPCWSASSRNILSAAKSFPSTPSLGTIRLSGKSVRLVDQLIALGVVFRLSHLSSDHQTQHLVELFPFGFRGRRNRRRGSRSCQIGLCRRFARRFQSQQLVHLFFHLRELGLLRRGNWGGVRHHDGLGGFRDRNWLGRD